MTVSFRTRRNMLTVWLVLIAVVATFVHVPVASAHVTISPSIVPPNVYQEFSVDVPTEKTVPTITVRVEIPAGLRVSRFQPKPGWTRTVEKDASGLIVAVTWTGGSVAPDEYEQFEFLARTPRETGPLVFKAYQTYEGGEVVGWIGAELDNFPASVVQVTDEAPVDGTDQPPTSIEEPVVTATDEATVSPEATTAGTEEAAATPLPATPTPAPSATVATSPSPLATAEIPPAGVATATDTGSDLGLFVALAALVVAVIGVALAIMGLVRRRGIS